MLEILLFEIVNKIKKLTILNLMPNRPFQNHEVAAAFFAFPKTVRAQLMFLRELIFTTAAKIPEVGELDEVLRWGEPSYLTSKSKTGSLIRMGSKSPDQYAMYFHCQTNLIAAFKKLYPTEFNYQGNRAIIFSIDEKVHKNKLRHCISLALTYHRHRKSSKK